MELVDLEFKDMTARRTDVNIRNVVSTDTELWSNMMST